MKRIIVLFLISVSLFSCSIEEQKNTYLELVKVKEVEMPTTYKVDSISQIQITYNRPTPCHVFSNFYYNSIGNERTVAIYCLTNNGQNCVAGVDFEVTVPLQFKPKNTGTYNFRFWTGVDDQGIDQYINHEVTVDH